MPLISPDTFLLSALAEKPRWSGGQGPGRRGTIQQAAWSVVASGPADSPQRRRSCYGLDGFAEFTVPWHLNRPLGWDSLGWETSENLLETVWKGHCLSSFGPQIRRHIKTPCLTSWVGSPTWRLIWMGFWPVLIVLVLVLVHQVQTFIGLLCPGGPGRFGCSLQPDEHLPVEEGHLLAFGRGSCAPGHAKLGLLKVLDFMVLWFYYGLFHILINFNSCVLYFNIIHLSFVVCYCCCSYTTWKSQSRPTCLWYPFTLYSPLLKMRCWSSSWPLADPNNWHFSCFFFGGLGWEEVGPFMTQRSQEVSSKTGWNASASWWKFAPSCAIAPRWHRSSWGLRRYPRSRRCWSPTWIDCTPNGILVIRGTWDFGIFGYIMM